MMLVLGLVDFHIEELVQGKCKRVGDDSLSDTQNCQLHNHSINPAVCAVKFRPDRQVYFKR